MYGENVWRIYLDWDRKYWDTRRNARANLIILYGIEQEPDYENKKGRIVDGNKLEHFKVFKNRLEEDLISGLGNSKG